jgi:hypothetical protein
MMKTRKQVNDILCNMKGQQLTGVYHGVKFSGVAGENRGVTVAPYDIELTIKLDAPIVVYGQEREQIVICGGWVMNETAKIDQLQIF